MNKHHGVQIIPERALIEVKGPEAAIFLQGLITTDIEQIKENTIRSGALLSPQGKVMFDFLVGKIGESFFLDTRRDIADVLVKRLTLYKLRSLVEIVLHEVDTVIASRLESASGLMKVVWSFADERFDKEKKIVRHYGKKTDIMPTLQDGQADNGQIWNRLRIEQGLAESGVDFATGDVFPHDINLDQTGGLSFKKGCYIGQEVVSRMQHRGTARRRLLITRASAPLPESGTVIEAAGRLIGHLGSTIDTPDREPDLSAGLALVRLDRAKAALDKEHDITAGGVKIRLEIPPGVRFDWPIATQAEGS